MTFLVYYLQTPSIYKGLVWFSVHSKSEAALWQVSSLIKNMVVLGSVLLLFLHFHGCFYFFIGRALNYDTVKWQEILSAKHSLGEQYSWAVFSAIGNTFPVTGYRPEDPFEQWITVLLVLVGATLYAILVGTISSFTFGLDTSGRLYKQKMDEVNEYMHYKKLSPEIKERVRQYYELRFRGKYFDEFMILDDLNISLRKDIAMHNCKDLISKVPFLQRTMNDGRDESFSRSIASALQPVYFIHGDIIFEQGQIGNEMYFIYVGVVNIQVGGKKVGSLRQGNFFGEVALLGQGLRTATIVAETDCVLYLFHRLDLLEILKDYEDMSYQLERVYEERMERVRKEMIEAEEEIKQKILAAAEVHQSNEKYNGSEAEKLIPDRDQTKAKEVAEKLLPGENEEFAEAGQPPLIELEQPRMTIVDVDKPQGSIAEAEQTTIANNDNDKTKLKAVDHPISRGGTYPRPLSIIASSGAIAGEQGPSPLSLTQDSTPAGHSLSRKDSIVAQAYKQQVEFKAAIQKLEDANPVIFSDNGTANDPEPVPEDESQKRMSLVKQLHREHTQKQAAIDTMKRKRGGSVIKEPVRRGSML